MTNEEMPTRLLDDVLEFRCRITNSTCLLNVSGYSTSKENEVVQDFLPRKVLLLHELECQ